MHVRETKAVSAALLSSTSFAKCPRHIVHSVTAYGELQRGCSCLLQGVLKRVVPVIVPWGVGVCVRESWCLTQEVQVLRYLQCLWSLLRQAWRGVQWMHSEVSHAAALQAPPSHTCRMPCCCSAQHGMQLCVSVLGDGAGGVLSRRQRQALHEDGLDGRHAGFAGLHRCWRSLGGRRCTRQGLWGSCRHCLLPCLRCHGKVLRCLLWRLVH